MPSVSSIKDQFITKQVITPQSLQSTLSFKKSFNRAANELIKENAEEKFPNLARQGSENNPCVNCKGKFDVKTICGEHYFCRNCRKDNECKKCKCQKCPKFNVEILKCGHKLCKDCKPCKECCEICFKGKASIIIPTCGHKICEQCYSVNSMCPCIKCIICNENRPLQRECKHLICKSCEYLDQYCLKCIEGYCSSCNTMKILYKLDCLHYKCLDCINNKIPCQECFKSYNCLYCKSDFTALNLPCQGHPQCDNCQNKYYKLGCVFCNNTENEYKCSSCEKIHLNLSKLECAHKVCDNCFINNGYYVCITCKNFKCISCQKIRPLNYKYCEHSLCIECQSNIGCTTCNNLNEFECENCFRYGASASCNRGHKLCGICLQINNQECLICKPFCCYCKKEYSDIRDIKITDCRHNFCKNCEKELRKRIL